MEYTVTVAAAAAVAAVSLRELIYAVDEVSHALEDAIKHCKSYEVVLTNEEVQDAIDRTQSTYNR
tara:strand:- start:537 stop:731 length:195 start_codon:yes stop_codon:yes gene_type:complete